MSDFTHCGDPNRRHDFVLLFDVTCGNPNGDPDSDNQPRQDDETNHGLVTDVCLKRKVRNYVALTHPEDEKPFRIYVQDKGIYLNDLHKKAHEAVKIDPKDSKNPIREKRDEARAWMCGNFYDVRVFGAVMSTGVNCGQVRGPIQMTFARSVDPISPKENSISRVALTDEKEKKEKEQPAETTTADEEQTERFGRTGTFGRKHIVPYGLYVGYGFFSAPFAAQTGVTREDVELFWKALLYTWDHDHSASRGLMACRGLYVFSHNDRLGNAPAHRLFEMIRVDPLGESKIPRSFDDYRDRIAVPNKEEPVPGVRFTSLES